MSGVKWRAWCALTSSSVSRATLARRAAGVAGVGVVAVDQAAEQQVGAEGRVVAVALQLGDDPAPRPGEGVGREGGPADHVGQELQGQRQVLGADAERGPGRADVERPADVLDRLGQRLGRAGLRPLVEQPAGQEAQAGLRLAEQAGVDEQLQRDDPRPRPPLGDQPQAVGQDRRGVGWKSASREPAAGDRQRDRPVDGRRRGGPGRRRGWASAGSRTVTARPGRGSDQPTVRPESAR